MSFATFVFFAQISIFFGILNFDVVKTFFHRGVKEVIFINSPEQPAFITARDCSFYSWWYNQLGWHYSASAYDCSVKCEKYGMDCSHYMHDGRDGKCHLYSGHFSTDSAYPDYSFKTTCGIHCLRLKTMECREILKYRQWIPKFYRGPPDNMLRSQGCFWNEETPLLSFHNSTLQQCVDECREVYSCTHYNFFGGDNCDLFQGMVEIKDMDRCRVPHCHCGLDCQSINDQWCHVSLSQAEEEAQGRNSYQVLSLPEPLRVVHNMQEYRKSSHTPPQ